MVDGNTNLVLGPDEVIDLIGADLMAAMFIRSISVSHSLSLYLVTFNETEILLKECAQLRDLCFSDKLQQ